VLGMVHHLSNPAGTHADAVLIDELHLAAVPGGLPDEVAAALPLAGLTAAQALDLLDLPAGATLLVTGALGSVGGFAVQLAAQRGLRVVAPVAPAESDAARALGAAVVAGRDGDLAAAVRAVVPGGVAGALDAASTGAVGAVRDGGRFVAVVAPALPAPERGVAVRLVRVQPDGRRLAELAGLLSGGALLTRVVRALPLAEAAAAHRLVEAGGIRGKVVLVP